MTARRVALIGHSGAGKTACLQALCVNRETADMDAGLGRTQCPTLSEAFSWLASDRPDSRVLVVSNHEVMLTDMCRAKLSRQRSGQFDCFCLVYLHKPLEELHRDLLRRTADGGARKADGVQYTIAHYERLHALYSQLADRTVECEGRSVEAVAAEVWDIASRLQRENV
jgi:shikimate kinase